MSDVTRLGFSGVIAKRFQDSKITPLLALTGLLMGLFAVAVTPREEEPQINVTFANIFVPFPGASAVEVERSGRRFPALGAVEYCEELQARIGGDPVFGEAFEALTPGRRRQYNMHFAGARKPATRERRIDACTERILMGKGLRDCICGHSKRMPSCDGSHRKLAATS